MIIGTTPTFTLTVPVIDGLDLKEAKRIYFTIRQGSLKITKTNEDIIIIDDRTCQVFFTQEETLQFRHNMPAKTQLNWTYPNGARAATQVKTINLSENLIREVLE